MAVYSDAERAEALAVLAANGGNAARTARQVGVPRSTLREWVRGAAEGRGHGGADGVPELREEKTRDLATELERIAWALVGAMEGKIETANLSHVATALGIALDKIRLLRGEATVITEDVTVARETLDGKLGRLAERFGAGPVSEVADRTGSPGAPA